MQSERIRWNRVVILIGVAIALLVVCVGIWSFVPTLRQFLVARYWKTDPQLAYQVAHKMLDYELPPHYQELRVMDMEGYAAVIIAHRERPGDLIYIGGLTDGIIDNAAWQARYEENLAREMGDRRYNAQAVDTRKATVRGQPVTLRLFEGTDESGRQVRELVCAFAGKSGDLLLGIVSSRETWDQAEADRFLQSIR